MALGPMTMRKTFYVAAAVILVASVWFAFAAVDPVCSGIARQGPGSDGSACFDRTDPTGQRATVIGLGVALSAGAALIGRHWSR